MSVLIWAKELNESEYKLLKIKYQNQINRSIIKLYYSLKKLILKIWRKKTNGVHGRHFINGPVSVRWMERRGDEGTPWYV